MRDLQQYISICQYELASIGIQCGAIEEIKVNTRAKRKFGLCQKSNNGYIIEISYILLYEQNPELALKNTIIHELLHTCEGCFNHGVQWQVLADKVNKHFGYHIQRIDSDDDIGIVYNPCKYKYVLKCKKCGSEFKRMKRSNFVAHPEYYRCDCGGKIVRIK